MYISAIVPAAGIGKRLQKKNTAVRPKQFWSLGGVLILEKVLMTLEASRHIKEIIIACSPRYAAFIKKEIIDKQKLKKITHMVRGGKERADSVRNCLHVVKKKATHVLVHDAVRPFMDEKLITTLCKNMKKSDGIIAARPVVPTLKKVRGTTILSTVDRSLLWEAETPQLFKKTILRKAYQQYHKKKSGKMFTDEASLVEAIGGVVKVSKVDQLNIKITTGADYCLSKKITEVPMVKVGIGYDIHRLVDKKKLILGGVVIPYHKGCLGHSDGDPLLHAIIDALLGALGLGDIGEHFPDTSPRYKNIASSELLRRVMLRMKKTDYVISHVDANIILQRPKLTQYKGTIRKRVAKLLGLDASLVNIKAKTNEGLESEGSGASISAQAVVTLQKK